MANITLPEPPDGYEYVLREKTKDTKTILEKRLDDLKSHLKKIDKPSDKELAEMGKVFHPYFMLENEIIMIEAQLKELKLWQ